jgi:hypothetical protein
MIMKGPVKKVTLPTNPVKVDPRERVAKRGLKTKVGALKIKAKAKESMKRGIEQPGRRDY